ncbi:hypothetical protein [Catellatospora sichuanensis]|uniref:hypothetical protein n=1 Tax=Catellatospora sichuanensis TaxID=1969805 RepID=UPI001183FB02|nr:hypothetical protein [Catellatospora sichuanensis]
MRRLNFRLIRPGNRPLAACGMAVLTFGMALVFAGTDFGGRPAKAWANAPVDILPASLGFTAAAFENHVCDPAFGGGPLSDQDVWVFKLPGDHAKTGDFVSVTATFTAADGTETTAVVPAEGGGVVLRANTSKAWVALPQGWTLTGAKAEITGTAPLFVLARTCPAEGSVVPPVAPEPDPSASADPHPSHSANPDPSDTPNPDPSDTANPDPSASAVLLPSGAPEPSVAPSVAPEPSVAPSVVPEPSVAPSVAPEPSVAPSVAPEPSVAPSVAPEPSAPPSGRARPAHANSSLELSPPPSAEPVEPPVVDPSAPPSDPIVDPSAPPSDPIVDPSAPPSDPIVDPSAPPVDPIVDPSAPPSDPIVDPSAPPVDPIVDPSAPPSDPIVDPSAPPVDPIVDPSAAPEPSDPPVTPGHRPRPAEPGPHVATALIGLWDDLVNWLR